MRNLFLSIDGIDGAGKSTQIALLATWYAEQGIEPVQVRDPGGTELGEAIREILLHRQEIPLGIRAEMLLYMASRAQLVEELIRPSLEAGRTVISDRYLLANVVYQSVDGRLSPDTIWQVGAIATSQLYPDLTVILDLPPEIAMSRLQGGLDRLESRGIDYMRRVRQGFLEQAQRMPHGQCVIIDATQSPDQMHAAIVEAVRCAARAAQR
ncbi:MAG: dTMP kinase [Planctomycetota bacterium]|nr:MAG: dTMP kinase [Planctomycetota bacterium]